MTQPQSPSLEEQIARLETELQTALHDLHQRADTSAELDAARAELARASDVVDALEQARLQIERLNAELHSTTLHLSEIQGELGPNALPTETLRMWRDAATAEPDAPAAAALLATIGELEATRVQLAAIRGELDAVRNCAVCDLCERSGHRAARATAEHLLSEDVDDTALAAAEADLERLDSRTLSPQTPEI